LNNNNDVHVSLAKLVEGTQPAGFGYQGKDVVDESYRKASKLDTSAFSTDFCPYEAGIVDVIGQALRPQRRSHYQGIRAELYKLNVSILKPNYYMSQLLTQIADLSSSIRPLQATRRHSAI
jgi:hypothetical protein